MKLITVAFLLITSFSFAQVTIESPYVFEGSSIELTIPSGLYKIEHGMGIDPTFLSFDKNLSSIEFLGEVPEGIIITHIIEKNDGSTILEMFNEEVSNDPDTEILSPAKLLKVGDMDVLMTQAKMDDGEDAFFMNFSLLKFHDCIIMIALTGVDQSFLKSNNKKYEELVKSIKVVETDRENLLSFEDEYSQEDDVMYTNSKFETQLYFENVFFDYPDTTAGWEEDYSEPYPELLICYTYFRNPESDDPIYEGSVKVFSGGNKSNYWDAESVADALSEVFPQHNVMSVTKDETTLTEKNEFTSYTVKQKLRDSPFPLSLYTTIESGELVFILFDPNANATEDFKGSYATFIDSMWIVTDEE